MARKIFGYRFKSTYRAPDKNLFTSVSANIPKGVTISKMVKYRNIILNHRTFYDIIRAELPEDIIQSHPTEPFFPKASPFRQVVIDEIDI